MPSNSFFDWGASVNRFVRFDAARAEEVNTALDNVTSGFDDVEVKTNAAIKFPDGETATALGNAATRANKFLIFDGAGNPSLSSPSVGLGTVVGPASSTDGAIAVFDGVTGELLKSAISGTHIKTVNGVSLMGAGDISTGLAVSVNSTDDTITAAINVHYGLAKVTLQAVNLPASAGLTGGEQIWVTVANGLITNTIVPNGTDQILGLNETMTIDNAYVTVQLRWIDATRDWRVL